jgi:predicted transcriptional regulator
MTTPDDNIRRVYLHHYDRAVELTPTQQQADVLRILNAAGAPVASTQIAASLNVTIQHANVLLRQLRLNGYVTRVGKSGPKGGCEYHYEVAAC